ncbi:hypothetical protein [Cohnella yongneupensis]|uniref:DUF2798 domain-containing protein n=1 Tax=Cohnella yongneupensis TaxID=425006 RepID=A0ABW0R3X3_9BACL
MSLKRYSIFVLLLLCSFGVDFAIDIVMGMGNLHLFQNLAFVLRMMGATERILLFALIVLFVRKPIGKAIGSLFGSK